MIKARVSKKIINPEVVSLGEPLLEFNAIESGPLSQVGNFAVGWGGDTSNFAVAVSRLGGNVGYICRIGGDEFGKVFDQLWKSEGIDTKHVVKENDSFTGIYFISRYEDTHQITYYRKDSAASHLSPKDVPLDYITNAKIFHTSGISQAISESACEAVFYAIEVARKANVLVSYDPNLRLKLWEKDHAREIVMASIELSDFVFPSLEDAIILCGLEDPESILKFFLEKGPRIIALKMGNNGVLLGAEEDIYYITPHKVKVVDTIGAGDAFDGGFVTAYLKGYSLRECARYANIVAALTTTGYGAVRPIPSRGKVDPLFQKD